MSAPRPSTLGAMTSTASDSPPPQRPSVVANKSQWRPLEAGDSSSTPDFTGFLVSSGDSNTSKQRPSAIGNRLRRAGTSSATSNDVSFVSRLITGAVSSKVGPSLSSGSRTDHQAAASLSSSSSSTTAAAPSQQHRSVREPFEGRAFVYLHVSPSVSFPALSVPSSPLFILLGVGGGGGGSGGRGSSSAATAPPQGGRERVGGGGEGSMAVVRRRQATTASAGGADDKAAVLRNESSDAEKVKVDDGVLDAFMPLVLESRSDAIVFLLYKRLRKDVVVELLYKLTVLTTESMVGEVREEEEGQQRREGAVVMTFWNFCSDELGQENARKVEEMRGRVEKMFTVVSGREQGTLVLVRSRGAPHEIIDTNRPTYSVPPPSSRST